MNKNTTQPSPQNLERKTFAATVVGKDEKQGVIEAIVSVFNNVDTGKDRILPGFFAKSITRKFPKGVWFHDWSQPVAKTLACRELMPGDPMLPPKLKQLGGAYIKGQFNLDTQRGREAFSDIDFGIIDEFSIGYLTTKETYDAKTGVRNLHEGEWFEWSPVLVGMNPATQLLTVKSGAQSAKPVRISQWQKELKQAHADLADLRLARLHKGRLSEVDGMYLDTLDQQLGAMLFMAKEQLREVRRFQRQLLEDRAAKLKR